nr:MAG TPA: hypothetical protein [Bacteriophage sp.]
MPRRKTVALNIPLVEEKIKIVFRRNVIFCEAMGVPGRSSWVSDWKRGKNLPSPEEAARMCAILQVEPEEILTEPSDIELVRSLIEQERGIKKDPIPKDGGVSSAKRKLLDVIDDLTDEQCSKLLGIILEAKKVL